MVLSKKSWHFFLHRLVFGDDARMPTNFCPYFWKSIVLGTIITIFFLPFAVPLLIARAIWLIFKIEDPPPSPLEEGLWSEYSVMTIFLDAAMVILYCMFAMWFYSLPFDKEGHRTLALVHAGGLIGWAICVGVGIHFFIKYIKEKKRKSYHRKMEARNWVPEEDTPNVFVEAVKSWYHRNCPIIKWKE